MKKDPGIPNLFPGKQELLEKIAQKREEERIIKEKKKARKKMLKEQRQEMMEREGLDGSDYAKMIKLQLEAKRREEEFEARQELLGIKKKQQDELDGVRNITQKSLSQSTKRAYYKEFKKVMESSDVILFVLDARDPLGCRCPDIEKQIKSMDANKKIILLLNKIGILVF